MATYKIDENNEVTAFANRGDAGEGDLFSSEAALTTLAAEWPTKRLVEIWNKLPGAKPVSKFKDRETAVARIWKAVRGRKPVVAPETADVASDAEPVRVDTPADKRRAPSGETSKGARVRELLEASRGATLAELMVATDWQAHSVRGFLSGVLRKKMGLAVESAKREEGERVYRISR
jgi:hypothetical protein